MGHGFHGELLNNQRVKFQEWMNRNEQNIMELYQPLNTCSTSDSFQVRNLKELTIISWNELLQPHLLPFALRNCLGRSLFRRFMAEFLALKMEEFCASCIANPDRGLEEFQRWTIAVPWTLIKLGNMEHGVYQYSSNIVTWYVTWKLSPAVKLGQNKQTPGGDIGDITGIFGPETGHFLSWIFRS